jgi:CRISPR locus-related DNA-binding protein
VIIFATLGFDEKFILRDILRRGIKEEAKLLVFTSSADPRVEDAFTTLKTTFMSMPLKIEKYTINIEDPFSAISEIRNIILENIKGQSEIIFNLSGGQRILLSYILSVIASERINCEIVMISEDSSFQVSLPSKIFFAKQIDPLSLEIVNILKEKPLRAGEILNKLGREKAVGRTTVWRRLIKLMKEGIVEYDRKTRRYNLTQLGQSLF